jgi:two-component system, chemotaxis family, protein-glutamate methylesterase/glutaminase
MAHRNLIVIGASAGGIEALQSLLAALPLRLDAALLVVLHTSRHAGSLLPQIMRRASPLPAIHPHDRTPIQNGTVYIAPPDFHMTVEGSMIRITQGPRENLHRPAIDPLFRSAAAYFGRRVVGIVLTGLLDDGTAGLMVVRARGGEAIVQDPATAMFDSMPQSALDQVPDARVLPLNDIPAALLSLINEELPEKVPGPTSCTAQPTWEASIAEFNMPEIEDESRYGTPSAFACPDCGGVLWELEDEGFLRFRCRVGHAFTARHLGAEQQQALETALWSALRALEENASLYHRMADRASNASHAQTEQQYRERATNITTNAHILRDFLIRANQDQGNDLEPAEP